MREKSEHKGDEEWGSTKLTDWLEPLRAILFSRFRSIAKSYFRRADGVLLLYDVTCEKSFLNVREWVDMIEVRIQNREPKNYTGELQPVSGNAVCLLCQNELNYKPLIQALRKNWMWEAGFPMALGSTGLLLSSWASSHRAKDTTKVSFWGGEGGETPGFSYRYNQNLTGSKWKFRQPKKEKLKKKEKYLSQTRGWWGWVCSVTRGVTGASTCARSIGETPPGCELVPGPISIGTVFSTLFWQWFGSLHTPKVLSKYQLVF